MPSTDPDLDVPRELSAGKYTISRDAFKFTNVNPAGTIAITNDSPRPIDFTLRKVRHRTFTATGPVEVTTTPMTWLAIGEQGATQFAQSYSVRVPGNGGEAIVELANAATGVPSVYEGELVLESEIGDRKVLVEFATSPEGRWSGKAYYFTQFGERNISTWALDPSSEAALAQVGNAFVQKWGALRAGRITMDEFQAVLTATVTGSWQWPSVQALCDGVTEGACYLYDNLDGFAVYTDDVSSQPVPSGVVEMPFGLDVKLDGTALVGRIPSGVALQYAGDPEALLTFADDPGTCAPGVQGACMAYLSGFEANVAVGGRYQTESSDTTCALATGGGFELAREPWLVPGFVAGTEIDPAAGVRYRYECRDAQQPFGAEGALTLSHPLI